MSTKKKPVNVVCPYCREKAVLVTGKEIYANRKDLWNKKYWLCFPCDAYVGVHANSNRNVPLGRLANKDLRYWKTQAHLHFDPLWHKKMHTSGVRASEARSLGYAWLAKLMGVEKNKCHIGMFDVEQCKQVVDICSKYLRKM